LTILFLLCFSFVSIWLLFVAAALMDRYRRRGKPIRTASFYCLSWVFVFSSLVAFLILIAVFGFETVAAWCELIERDFTRVFVDADEDKEVG
jgi:hypothetical protein